MATTINLTNVEILDYSHTSSMVEGDVYQFGRTVSMSLTAFMLPSGVIGEDSKKFKSIDDKQKDHLKEVLDNGFADQINIAGETVDNVRILSYDFPTEPALANKINLLRVTMAIEYKEAFDNRESLKKADPEIYTDSSLEVLQTDYAKYFESFSETYSFQVSDGWQFSFNQNISFGLSQRAAASIDLVTKAKAVVNSAFLNDPPKIGYVDTRYNNFIQLLKARGRFNESYDSINDSYSFSRSVEFKAGAHKSELRGKNWTAGLTYGLSVDQSGSATITETGEIQAHLGLGVNETPEFLYQYAFDGLQIVKKSAYSRCNALFKDFIKDKKLDSIPNTDQWDRSNDLKERYVSFGKNINRVNGSINYTTSFTNNPKMHDNGIFEYTISSARDANKNTKVTESGSIKPYDENKNVEFNPKVLYDKFTNPVDVLARIKSMYESVSDKVKANVVEGLYVLNNNGSIVLEHPKNLVSSSVSFPAYGVTLSYEFSYSDDLTLRNGTYIRKIGEDESYNLPTIHRQNVIAPNIKETNYDANQTKGGGKTVNFNCVFKRYPLSNVVNEAYTDYINTATKGEDGVFASLKRELEKRAFIKGKQNSKGKLNFYLKSLSYNFNSKYSFSFTGELGFVDKRGVAATALEY
jgi:hypothetical protein